MTATVPIRLTPSLVPSGMIRSVPLVTARSPLRTRVNRLHRSRSGFGERRGGEIVDLASELDRAARGGGERQAAVHEDRAGVGGGRGVAAAERDRRHCRPDCMVIVRLMLTALVVSSDAFGDPPRLPRIT